MQLRARLFIYGESGAAFDLMERFLMSAVAGFDHLKVAENIPAMSTAACLPAIVSSNLTRAALHSIAKSRPGQTIEVVLDNDGIRLANGNDPEVSITQYALTAGDIVHAKSLVKEDLPEE